MEYHAAIRSTELEVHIAMDIIYPCEKEGSEPDISCNVTYFIVYFLINQNTFYKNTNKRRIYIRHNRMFMYQNGGYGG